MLRQSIGHCKRLLTLRARQTRQPCVGEKTWQSQATDSKGELVDERFFSQSPSGKRKFERNMCVALVLQDDPGFTLADMEYHTEPKPSARCGIYRNYRGTNSKPFGNFYV